MIFVVSNVILLLLLPAASSPSQTLALLPISVSLHLSGSLASFVSFARSSALIILLTAQISMHGNGHFFFFFFLSSVDFFSFYFLVRQERIATGCLLLQRIFKSFRNSLAVASANLDASRSLSNKVCI